MWLCEKHMHAMTSDHCRTEKAVTVDKDNVRQKRQCALADRKIVCLISGYSYSRVAPPEPPRLRRKCNITAQRSEMGAIARIAFQGEKKAKQHGHGKQNNTAATAEEEHQKKGKKNRSTELEK